MLAYGGSGAAIGALGGYGFSPNDESRGINALVFGLAGAVIGGLIGILTDMQPPSSEDKPSLKERDLGSVPTSRDYIIPTDQKLPSFVKERLQPVVIEESVQQDTVTDDGALHEPHKVYRIKRPSELYSNPVKPNAEKAQQ
jgi:hypothetical protein